MWEKERKQKWIKSLLWCRLDAFVGGDIVLNSRLALTTSSTCNHSHHSVDIEEIRRRELLVGFAVGRRHGFGVVDVLVCCRQFKNFWTIFLSYLIRVLYA